MRRIASATAGAKRMPLRNWPPATYSPSTLAGAEHRRAIGRARPQARPHFRHAPFRGEPERCAQPRRGGARMPPPKRMCRSPHPRRLRRSARGRRVQQVGVVSPEKMFRQRCSAGGLHGHHLPLHGRHRRQLGRRSAELVQPGARSHDHRIAHDRAFCAHIPRTRSIGDEQSADFGVLVDRDVAPR